MTRSKNMLLHIAVLGVSVDLTTLLLCTTKFEPFSSCNATDFARAARVVALYFLVRSDRVVMPDSAASASQARRSALAPFFRPFNF